MRVLSCFWFSIGNDLGFRFQVNIKIAAPKLEVFHMVSRTSSGHFLRYGLFVNT
jgi:hypothetical protein